MWKEAEANGTYEFAYPYRAERWTSEIAYLTIVVVRENDAWKVSSYSLAEVKQNQSLRPRRRD